MRLIVRSWRDFQHYKDRAPPWIRLHRSLLDNKDFQRLPVECRALAPMLWLIASESVDGVIDASVDDLAFRLRCSEAEIEKGLGPLIAKRFLIEEGEVAEQGGDEKTLSKRTAEKNGFGSRHISDNTKREVWERDEGKCCACSATSNLEYDHKTPVSKGGNSEPTNIQLLCRPCNRKKRVKTAEQSATHAQPWLELRTSETETEAERDTEAFAETDAEAELFARPAAQAVSPPKSRKVSTPKPEAPSASTWNAYAEAYQLRYGAIPVRNATVNGQLAQVVGRIGAEESPQVAAFFVGNQNRLYVSAMHPVNLLLRDCEKLRTEWATGTQVTATQAAMADKTQTNFNSFAPLLAQAEAEAINGKH